MSSSSRRQAAAPKRSSSARRVNCVGTGGLLLAPQLVDEGNVLLDERLVALIERIRQKPVRCDDRKRQGLDRVAKRLWDVVALDEFVGDRRASCERSGSTPRRPA